MHICYGYGIQANIDWKATLGSEWRQYEEIFPALNACGIDQVSLECANSKVPLALLGLLKDKELLVGAIDVVSHEIESPAQVAATIDRALAFVAPERLFPCTNCGMAAPAPGSGRGQAQVSRCGRGAGSRANRQRVSPSI